MRALRILAATLLGLVVFVAVVAGVGWWVLGREATLQRIVAEVQKRMGDQLRVDGVRGSLYDRVEFDRLVFRTKTHVITAEAGAVRYRLEPFERRFTILALHARRLVVETIAKSDEPTVEPDTLEIPAGARIDTLSIEDARIDAIDLVAGGRTTTLHQASLRGRYATEGGSKRWTVDAISVRSPWGDANGVLTVGAAKPFPLDARLTAQGKAFDVPYRAPLTATGRLGNLSLSSDFVLSDPAGHDVGGHLDARVLPFREQPLDRALLHVAGVSPQRWKADLPEADLTVDADVTPLAGPPPASAGAFPFRGRARIVNAAPGPVDRDRIPLASIEAVVSGDANGVVLDALNADLGAAGKLHGRGSYRFADQDAALTGKVDDLDLHAIQGKLIASKFDGPLAVTRSHGVLHVETDLADTGRKVRFRGDIDGPRVRIAETRVAVGGSTLNASGQVDLSGPRPFAIQGDVAHFDPHDFGDFQKADVTAAFDVSGTMGAEPSARAPQVFRVASDLRIAPSRVFGHAVAGTAAGTVEGAIAERAGKGGLELRSVSNAKVALAFGSNRVGANGSFGRPGDRLAWDVDAPRLVELGYGVSGSLNGRGVLGGTLVQPSIDFDLAGDQLRYAKTVAPAAGDAPVSARAGGTAAKTTAYALRTLTARGRMLAGSEGVLDADLSVVELRDGPGPALVQNLDGHVKGTRAAHTLSVTARSDRFDVSGIAHGGLDAKNRWSGTVDQLDSRGRVPFALEASAPLSIGSGRVEVGSTRLRFTEGRVELQRLVVEDGTVATAGGATGFPLAILGTFSRDFAHQVSTSLKFGAQWDLRVGETVDGKVRLFRESGDVQFLTEPRFSVDPERAEVAADIVANRVAARIDVAGRGLGHVDATFDTVLSKRDGQWGLAGDAPLVLEGDVDIPDLRWLARLSGRPGLDLVGHLVVAVTGRGSIAKPMLAGHATGERIGVRWPEQGLNFRDGTINVDFDGDRIVLRDAVLAGGQGKVTTTGELRLGNRRMSGSLAVVLDRFESVSRTDRTVVVSGKGAAKFGPTGIDVTADLKADHGSLQLAERRGPTMSDDIVVVGREKDEEVPARSLPVRFQVRFDMGDDFKVKGSGFEGKLGGVISLAGPGAYLRAIGTVSVREGNYVTYGQTLSITRGNLTFSGPIDNPALDILAVRKNLAVEAGVQVSGTAIAPVAHLTSTPDVPDTEKLSWLLLGHGLSATNKSDLGLLTTAAASLLESSDSTAIQSRIAAMLGVDEIGVSGLGGSTGGLLTVGKQISSRLRVTLEQGFQKAATLLKARYNIYKQIDLQVQTGTDTAVDVFYTFSFD